LGFRRWALGCSVEFWGSSYEIQTQLEIAEFLGYLSEADSHQLLAQAESVGRMLNGMITKFRQVVAETAA
jgi:hypothetical protein